MVQCRHSHFYLYLIMNLSGERHPGTSQESRRPFHELHQDEVLLLAGEMRALDREKKDLEMSIGAHEAMELRKNRISGEIRRLSEARYGWRDHVSPEAAEEIEGLLNQQRRIRRSMDEAYREQYDRDSRVYPEVDFSRQEQDLVAIDARIAELLPSNMRKNSPLFSANQVAIDQRVSSLRGEVDQLRNYFSALDERTARLEQVYARISELQQYLESGRRRATDKQLAEEDGLLREYADATEEEVHDRYRMDGGGNGAARKQDITGRLQALRRSMAGK